MESAASIPQEPLTRDPEEIPTSEVKLRQVVDMIPALVRFWSNLAYFPRISPIISRHSVGPSRLRVMLCAPCTRGHGERRVPAGAAEI